MESWQVELAMTCDGYEEWEAKRQPAFTRLTEVYEREQTPQSCHGGRRERPTTGHKTFYDTYKPPEI